MASTRCTPANGSAIAEVAEDFEAALIAAGYDPAITEPPVEKPEPAPLPDLPEQPRDPSPQPETPVTGIRWGRFAIAVAVVLLLVWWVFF